MEEYLKNEIRLIECYRSSSNQDEAEVNCATYLNSMVSSMENGQYDFKNIMKEKWKIYYNTKKYYEYGQLPYKQ